VQTHEIATNIGYFFNSLLGLHYIDPRNDPRNTAKS
jgi:hypothetical protein